MAREEKYRIVFRGELASGMSREEVVANLRGRLRFGDAALARLFAGKTVILKSELDEATAGRYVRALADAGVLCAVEPMPPVLASQEPVPGPAPSPEISCPKCGQSQPEAETCASCGVVIAKFRQRTEEAFLHETAGSGGAAEVATEAMLAALAGTRPWVRLVSLLLYIGGGLGLLATLISMLAVSHAAGGGPPAVLVGAAQVFACLLYMVPAWYLSRYAGALGAFLHGGGVAELEAALGHQKSFWKFVGILTLIMLVLAIIGIAAAILIPTLFAGR